MIRILGRTLLVMVAILVGYTLGGWFGVGFVLCVLYFVEHITNDFFGV